MEGQDMDTEKEEKKPKQTELRCGVFSVLRGNLPYEMGFV